MPYLYRATAPPALQSRVTWSHTRTDARGITVQHHCGKVLSYDPASGLCLIRRDSGSKERIAVNRLKLI